MTHPLEAEYGLTADELLDALSRRFRAKVTLEGAVAEVHLGKHVQESTRAGAIVRFEEHDEDGRPDYTVWLPGGIASVRVECKNVRDSDEAYRLNGAVVAYKVEVQKTRTSKADPSSRFYGIDQFDVLAVCLGKKTHRWHDFVFAFTADLTRHPQYPLKLAVMHRVPLSVDDAQPPWFSSLSSLLRSRYT